MNQQISTMPPAWAAVAYILIGLGIFFSVGFLSRYMLKKPWARTEGGRHIVAWSANVLAFLLLYGMLAIWPNFPGRGAIRFVLLATIVANAGWRWWLLEKTLYAEKKSGTSKE